MPTCLLATFIMYQVRGRWCAMIEQPLPDRKRDYWGTIFNTVVPDDNAGKVTGRTVNQENNILMLLCSSCDEEPRQPPLPQVRRRSEARAEI